MSKKQNNKPSSAPKAQKLSNNIINNINSNIKRLTPEKFKYFFKRYYQSKNGIKIKSESESDSTYSELPESSSELNIIYLHNLKNLYNFLQKAKNLKGVILRGNRLLENISINQFNEFFKEYGKSIQKKLKRHVLNYFYPLNNKPKLMGQKMNLTPIPLKRSIYLKNEKEKKDYKNAERAAVILRRLEYTHGLGGVKNKDEKIFFYLMKGAALIIEDWWIKIARNKKKNEDYKTLLGKIKNIDNDNINNSNERKNRFALNKKKGDKYNKYNNSNKKKNNNINTNNEKFQIKKIKKTKTARLKNEKAKIKKKNKIEIIEINLSEEQNKDYNILKKYKDNTQTEPRNTTPIISNTNPLNQEDNNNSEIIEINLDKKSNNKNKEKDINKKNKIIKVENKSVSARNVFDDDYNKYDIKKEKRIRGNPIKLIVNNKLLMRESKTNEDNKIANNINNIQYNKGLNRSSISNKSQNIFKNNKSNNYNALLTNKLNNLMLNQKYEIKNSSTAKKYDQNDQNKLNKEWKEHLSNISNINLNKNKLLYQEYDFSKGPNIINIDLNNKDIVKKLEQQKKQKCKVKTMQKIIKLNSDHKPKYRKGSKKKSKKEKKVNRSALIMENNINLSINYEEKIKNISKEKDKDKVSI